MTKPVHVGCSGWNYPTGASGSTRGATAASVAEHYAERFDTVEINNTFYRLPTVSAVEGWIAQALRGSSSR